MKEDYVKRWHIDYADYVDSRNREIDALIVLLQEMKVGLIAPRHALIQIKYERIIDFHDRVVEMLKYSPNANSMEIVKKYYVDSTRNDFVCEDCGTLVEPCKDEDMAVMLPCIAWCPNCNDHTVETKRKFFDARKRSRE